MNKLPRAKSADLVTQELGGELLIYDLTTDKACALNETCHLVYSACDGRTTFDELKRRHQFTDDLIWYALDEINREGLLESDYKSRFSHVSRRAVIKKVGLGTMLALPLISSIIAPEAIAAASSACLQEFATCNPAQPRCCPGFVCFQTSNPQFALCLSPANVPSR